MLKVSRQTVQSRLAGSSYSGRDVDWQHENKFISPWGNSRPHVLIRARAAAETQAGQQHSQWRLPIALCCSMYHKKNTPPPTLDHHVMLLCGQGTKHWCFCHIWPNLYRWLISFQCVCVCVVWLITTNDGLYLGKLLFLGTYCLQKNPKQPMFFSALN